MIAFRFLLPALCIASLSAAVAFAQSSAPSTVASSTPSHHWHGQRHGGFWGVLKQLNLTAEQQTEIRSIFEQARTQNLALRESIRSNAQSLAITAPTDSTYPALIATAESNATARIKAASDLKTQIYAVLTAQQIAQIPTLIASEQAAWKAKAAAWHAAHGQS
jgi:Spy/CpxP family protein refolding chaperone